MTLHQYDKIRVPRPTILFLVLQLLLVLSLVITKSVLIALKKSWLFEIHELKLATNICFPVMGHIYCFQVNL